MKSRNKHCFQCFKCTSLHIIPFEFIVLFVGLWNAQRLRTKYESTTDKVF